MSLAKWLQRSIVDTGLQYTKQYSHEISNLQVTHQSLWAWKSDKALSEIVLLSKAHLIQDIHIEISDFKSETACLAKEHIKTFFVKEVKGFIGHAGWYAHNLEGIMPTGPKESFPDVLMEKTAFSLEAHTPVSIWIEFNVPDHAKAGIYKGTISFLSTLDDEKLVFDYELEVLEAVLPSARNYRFDVEYWHHPYSSAEYYNVVPFSSEHLDLLKSHLSLYKELGGHALTATIVEEAWGGQTYSKNPVHYPSMIKWIKTLEGKWSFDYTHFDKWVQLGKDLNIADVVICYSMLPWNNKITYYDELTMKQHTITVSINHLQEYRSVWIPFLEAFIEHLEEKNWFDTIYMGYDERHNMGAVFDIVDEIKNKDGKTLNKSAAFNDFEGNQQIFNRLDSASVGLEEIRQSVESFKAQVEKRKREGKKTTMYTATEHFPNSFIKSMPVESYWTIMYAGSLGATGYLRWAFDAWVEDPLEDATHSAFQAGDCFLVYPSPKEKKVKHSLRSIRLTKLDEGVRDLNKLYLIKETNAYFKHKVETLLEKVKSQYPYEEVETPTSWAIAGRPAKWATSDTKYLMVQDMNALKAQIKDITQDYIHYLKISNANTEKF